MANCCTLCIFCHFSRNSHDLWTVGFVEVQKRSLGIRLRLFLHDTHETWPDQIVFIAFAHNTQPIHYLNVSPNETVFHTQLRFPLNFQLKFSRNSIHEGTAQFCSELPSDSQYQSTVSSPLFHRIRWKPFFNCFLAFATAMMQFFQNSINTHWKN